MTRSAKTQTITRRRMLARLGLMAGTIYTAPTLLHLTPAHASGASGGSGGSSGPSSSSGPSASSGPSSSSGPSTSSGPSSSSRPSYGGGRSSGPSRNRGGQSRPSRILPRGTRPGGNAKLSR